MCAHPAFLQPLITGPACVPGLDLTPPYAHLPLRSVTGAGHIDVNRISGYIPGKIVFFLMQVGAGVWVCDSGEGGERQGVGLGGCRQVGRVRRPLTGRAPAAVSAVS